MSGGWIRGIENAFLNEDQKRLSLEPAENLGYITAWQIAGPFQGKIVGEPPPAKARWETKSFETLFVDIGAVLGESENSHAFARSWIWLDDESDGRMCIGSNDTVAVWINGETVHQCLRDRPFHLDEDRIKVKFAQGWNEILVSCGNWFTDWGFALRVDAGEDLDGLQTSVKEP